MAQNENSRDRIQRRNEILNLNYDCMGFDLGKNRGAKRNEQRPHSNKTNKRDFKPRLTFAKTGVENFNLLTASNQNI